MSETIVELAKLHGLGNDFLVSFAEGNPKLAQAACDRHMGFGADGLIQGTWTSTHRLAFRLWNADGSETETSGNGLRCLAHAALDNNLVQENEPFQINTPAGPRRLTIRRRSVNETEASVEMGAVEIVAAPTPRGFKRAAAADIGNPHLVVLVPDPAVVDVERLGPQLATGAPTRNVEFVSIGPDPNSITMRIWERGVGETLACGTGSCAAVAVLKSWGYVSREVTVFQPGGALTVELRSDNTAILTGPSVKIGRCELCWISADRDDLGLPTGQRFPKGRLEIGEG
jgi:diaminopimelate epimerase